MRIPLAVAAIVLVGVTSTPLRAEACSLFENRVYMTDPAASDDTTPPSAVTVSDVVVSRYQANENDSCIDHTSIAITLAATDDRAPRVGFQLALASGTAPAGLTLPAGPVAPHVLPDTLVLYYYDPHAAVDFELSARAVDLEGNLGPATTIRIVDEPDPASMPGGCSAGRGAPGSAGLILVLVGLVAIRRRSRGAHGDGR